MRATWHEEILISVFGIPASPHMTRLALLLVLFGSLLGTSGPGAS